MLCFSNLCVCVCVLTEISENKLDQKLDISIYFYLYFSVDSRVIIVFNSFCCITMFSLSFVFISFSISFLIYYNMGGIFQGPDLNG